MASSLPISTAYKKKREYDQQQDQVTKPVTPKPVEIKPPQSIRKQSFQDSMKDPDLDPKVRAEMEKRRGSYMANMEKQKTALQTQVQSDEARLSSVIKPKALPKKVAPLTNINARKQLEDIGIKVETYNEQMQKKKKATQ